MLGKLRHFGWNTLVLLIFFVSASASFADDLDVKKRNLDQVITKLQEISKNRDALTKRQPKAAYSEIAQKAESYSQANQRLERVIGGINAYATELRAKAAAGSYTKHDVNKLRRTFRQLNNAKKAVHDSLHGLSGEISKHGTASANRNIQDIVNVAEENTLKLEEIIAAITKKGANAKAEDFDELIQLTEQQKSDQIGQIVNKPLELRQAAPIESTPQVGLTNSQILAALAPPTSADLAETVEIQFTPEINQLAASLNNSAVDIYEYVRNQIEFELYFGSRKGGSATLLTKRGNDYDQASLILALLRTSGIPARYVRGTVEIPAQRVIDWLGLKTPEAANSILNTAGISATPIVGTGGAIEVYRIDRVWVAAHVPYSNYRGTASETTGSIWVPLDPAFNISQYESGVDNATDSVIFDEAGYLSTVRTDTAADYYRDQMFDYLAANLPGTSLVDVSYDGNVIPQAFGILPGSLPYTVRSVATEFSEVPGSLRHAVRVNVSSSGTLFQTNLLLPEVALQRRTISFVAATQADQTTIDGFGGIGNTPPFLANVKPQLKLDGVLVVEGTAISLGSDISVTIGFIEPEKGETDSVSHPFLTAGDYISVNLDVGQTTQELVTERSERLLNAIDTIGTPVPDAQQDDVIGELLNIGGMLYWLRMNDNNKLISDLYQYKEVLGVSESLTTSNMDVLYLFDRAYATMPGNLSLDAARLQHNRFSIDDVETDKAALNRLLGFESSAREHAMWEELVSVESVSTIKALQVAGQQGVPIHKFDSSTASNIITCDDGSTGTVLNCMARCGVSSFTRTSISSELSAGKEITTHECQIILNQWRGVGYVSADPVSQSGAYIISGGLNSFQEIGAETTIGGLNPVEQLSNQEGEMILSDLPTHIITSDNINTVLSTLHLPTRLVDHVEALVAQGQTATLSEVVVEINDLESLVFKLESDALEQAEYYRFDTLAGGSGTENPPGSLGDPNGNTGNGDGTGHAGDPVNIANGSFYREERDFAIPALGYPLAFDRFYNSGVTDDGSLGIGWTHTYSDKVFENGDGTVDWTTTKGGVYTFVPSGGGSYTTPDGIDSSLTKTVSRFILTSKKGEVQEFNLVGQMLSRKNSIGQGVDLTYSGGLLRTITDTSALARTIDITYNAEDRITSITDFTGRTWTYSYTNGLLSQVQSPSDAQTLAMVTQYSYYSGPLAQDLLRTITEPNGGTRRISYYTNDRVFEVRGPEGGRERFSYDILTNTTIYTDQRGNKTRYRHNNDGNIIEIRYADGSRERWVWNNHQIVSHQDTLGFTETFQYDSNRNLTRHTDRMGLVTTYTHDPSLSVMTQMTRPGGRVFNYTYNSSGILTRVDDPEGGSHITTNINSFGLPNSSTDPRGVTTQFQYNATGQQTGVSVSGEYSVTIVYTPRGKISRAIDANGHASIMEYDLLDRLVRSVDAEGNETLWEYDAGGRNTKVINPRGFVSLIGYDLNDRVISQTDALTNSLTRNYDLAGNLVSEVDRLGRVTMYEYDNRNRQVKSTFPNGTTLKSQFNSENILTAIIDPLGNKTTYTVDGNGRISSSTDALLNSTTQTYDINGNIESTTNRRGGVTNYEYDLFNQITKITSEGGYLATFDYDAIGKKTQFAQYDISGLTTVPADPRTLAQTRKRTVDYVNNVLGLPVTVTDPEGNIEQIIRDPKGNPISIIDKRSKITSYVYDKIDRVVKIIQPDLTEVNIAYDENSNLKSITTATGGVWQWTYDELDRVQTAADPLSRVTQYEYDAVGNLIKKNNPDASSVSYSYDALNRKVHAARSDGTYTSFMYDSAGNLVLGETEKTILISTFDALNRVSSEYSVMPTAGLNQQIGFGYDVESNLTSVDIDAVGIVNYGYDLANRLTTVNNGVDSSSVTVGYNGFGDRSLVAYGNGTTGSLSYDKVGRIKQIDYGSTIAQIGYVRDPDGNPTTINETIAGITETLAITYDDFGRPVTSTASVSPVRNETFSYDQNGNMVNTGTGNVAKYDIADQISYDGSSTFAKDARGNTTQKNELGGVVSNYTYDPEDRLVHVRQSVGSTIINEFDNIYDALDRLVKTNANGVPILRVYAGLNPIVDFNANGSINTLYTTGPALDDVFAVSIEGVQHYLHRDPMGSVRTTTSSSGVITGSKDYSLYGRIQNQTGSSDVLLGFTGRPFDPTTGLLDLRARWLDPEIGRFMSRDPAPMRPVIPNPYLYADDKPLRFVDPLGLTPQDPGFGFWDGLQLTLEGAGLFPGLGIVPDLANAGISLVRGNGLDALGHLGSAVPGLGQGVTAAKWADKAADGVKAVDKLNDARKAANAADATKAAGKTDSALDVAKKEATQLEKNKAAGDAFEKQVKQQKEQTLTDIAEQVTVKTESGVKTRIDLMGKDADGNIVCIECKASQTAPLTKNQKKGFPEIQESGAVVVGKGKPGFPGGTQIPPTKVEIIRGE